MISLQQGEVALLAELPMGDAQAYICMDCKGGIPAPALGVGGKGPWRCAITILY